MEIAQTVHLEEVRTYLEKDEVERLEEAAGCLRDKLLIRLLFRLGCRVSEALSLAVDHISWVSSTVVIRHLKARVRLSCPECSTRLSKTARFCPGCGARVEKVVKEEKERRRQRTLPLDQETLEMLREYVERGGPVEVKGQQFLFGLSRSQAWRIVRASAEQAGLGNLLNPETGRRRGISPHRLRDAFAVMAVKRDDSGDGLRLLQEQLGHQSIATTMKYRKIAGQEHRQWYEKLWQEDKDQQNINHR